MMTWHGSGLIPARAGSTAYSLKPGGTSWAHPRPCGEHGVQAIQGGT